ncbi:MAG: deoxyuridine 5'-triphosphate nucleotidohydrolase [Candidatus Thorarchaeota archaeon]
MVVIDRQTILELIARHKLLTNLIDEEVQISPNGVELTLQKVYAFKESGTIDFSNCDRHIPDYEEVPLQNGQYMLNPGAFLVTYNENVRIPRDMIAIGRPRSSLLRSGVTIESAVWDAGYEGRSRGLLIVYNPHGFKVKPQARLLHLIFLRLLKATDAYEGIYQGER